MSIQNVSRGAIAWLLVCLVASHACAQRKETPDIVFLLIGEINMCGQAEPNLEKGDDQPYPNVLLLSEDGVWETARQPLNRYSTIRDKQVRQQFGMGAAFAQRIQKSYPGVKVGLIVNARINTNIDSWSPESPLYLATLRRVNAQRNVKLSGILWHHGESNQFDRNYLEKLIRFVEQWRADFEDPKLPFIAGEIHGTRPYVNEYINRLPNHLKWTSVAPAKDLKAIEGARFDRDSLVKLGERYAEGWLSVAAPEYRPVLDE